jgi:hypothetical protein
MRCLGACAAPSVPARTAALRRASSPAAEATAGRPCLVHSAWADRRFVPLRTGNFPGLQRHSHPLACNRHQSRDAVFIAAEPP